MPSHIKVLESLSTFVDTRSLIIILTLAYFLCIYAPFEGWQHYTNLRVVFVSFSHVYKAQIDDSMFSLAFTDARERHCLICYSYSNNVSKIQFGSKNCAKINMQCSFCGYRRNDSMKGYIVCIPV